jgi:Tol biopolymer transport system component
VLLASALQGQVIFSRRVYAERGRSYQQIWRWDAATGGLKPLTRSPRDHNQLSCSRDGKRILSVSENGSADSVWSLDLATGAEHQLWQTSGAISADLVGIAHDGAPLVDKGWIANRSIVTALFRGGPHPFQFPGDNQESALSPDGKRLARFVEPTPDSDIGPAVVTDAISGRALVSLGKCGEPVWSHDGAHLACTSGFLIDSATGKSRVPIGKCNMPRWSSNDARVACFSEPDVFIVNAGTGREIERVPLPALAGAHFAQEFVWSPDGGRLLLGIVGASSNSTAPYSDYAVLDVARKAWILAGSGNHASWVPGRDAIVYSTPRDLIPLPSSEKLQVWSAQLAVYDLAARKQTLLTSGITNNEEPTVCPVRDR